VITRRLKMIILVKGVAGDKGALGFLPLAYFLENSKKVKALAIVNKQGKATLPSKETVESAAYNPLSRPLFIYVSEEAAKRAEVKEFVNMYLSQAYEIVPQVKYVALPKKAYETAAAHFKKGKLGTVFKGHAGVGMTIDELLKKEAAQ
jgi:phosphate transport system substrate-binding protein